MEVLSPIDPTVVSARSAAAAWRLVAPETACFVLVGGYGQLWDKLQPPVRGPHPALVSRGGPRLVPGGCHRACRRRNVRGPDRRRHAAARRPPVRGGGLSTAPPGSEACGHRRPAERRHRQGDRRVPPPVLGVPDRHGPELPRARLALLRLPRLVLGPARPADAGRVPRRRVGARRHRIPGACRGAPAPGAGEMFPETDVGAELVRLEVADWPADPWARGAVSVEPVGGAHLRAELALPTPPLFWAGEATATDGGAECVHGALTTGRRGRAGSAASPAAGVGHRSDEPAGVGPVSRLSVRRADGARDAGGGDQDGRAPGDGEAEASGPRSRSSRPEGLRRVRQLRARARARGRGGGPPSAPRGERALVVQADVSREEDIVAMFRTVDRELRPDRRARQQRRDRLRAAGGGRGPGGRRAGLRHQRHRI